MKSRAQPIVEGADFPIDCEGWQAMVVAVARDRTYDDYVLRTVFDEMLFEQMRLAEEVIIEEEYVLPLSGLDARIAGGSLAEILLFDVVTGTGQLEGAEALDGAVGGTIDDDDDFEKLR